MRANWRRGREERRRQLTRSERALLWVHTLVGALLAPVGIALLAFGGNPLRAAALVCVFAGLVLMAVPISPFLRARIRRREAQERAERQH
jgi:hypothetical protein